MKVISYKICPFVQRVTALLEAKNVPYEIEYINLKHKPQWFLDISPNSQVPVLLTDNGAALFESEAIVEYLEETYPALQPATSPEDRALERAWSYLAAKNYLVQCSAQRSPDQTTLTERREKLDQAFDKIEKQLDQTAFFAGDTLGLVDVAWLPLLHRADIIDRYSGYDFLAGHPKLKAWQKNLMASGIAEKSVAPDFEEAFTDCYLSDRTFLGRGYDRHVPHTDNTCVRGACC